MVWQVYIFCTVKISNQGLVCGREQHGTEAKVESGFAEDFRLAAEWQWCGRLCVGCLRGADQTESYGMG